MKKQIVFLYVALIFFLVLGGGALYVFFSAPEPPSVLDEYDYDDIQALVTVPPRPEISDSVPVVSVPAEEVTAEPLLFFGAEQLSEINPDFCGWLMIPDTAISLPVVYAKDYDATEYYLKYSFSGQKSVFGCLFFDPSSVEGSTNRVIHGHNMGRNRDEMFSSLVVYLEPEFAASHKQFYFAKSMEHIDTYEIFAVLHFDVAYQLSECNYMQPNFESQEEYREFVSYFIDRSVYKTEFIPESEIMILSTCHGSTGTSNRLLICAGKIS